MIITEIKESCAMAIGAVAAHKLRSALTLLGVLVGVFSIILVMTAMRALQNVMESELTQLGANTFQVQKWPAIYTGGPEGLAKYIRRENITYDTMAALRREATLAKAVGAELWQGGSEVSSKYEKTNPDVSMVMVSPEIFAARNWTIEQGRAIMRSDLEGARNVCVLGNELSKKLFPHGGSLGEYIRYRGAKFNVIGILESKGGTIGGQQGNFLAIPITTGMNRYTRRASLNILIQAYNQELFEDTIEQTRGILRKLRKVEPTEEDDFEIVTNDSLIKQFKSITFAVRIGVTAVSSIALLAAGIGIMNIMLVSVTERTREIGIRRAVGAKKRNILVQFVTEAIAICQIGGVLGIVLGIIGGNIAAKVLNVPAAIPFDWVLIGLLICCAVGVVFGTYPAYKASNIDPIDALRYE
ncbi:MAG: ABC transporter permease [Verrucomicrobia bacterium]|nr:ABC transporter permease [Verrucomicrobiota bacterium]